MSNRETSQHFEISPVLVSSSPRRGSIYSSSHPQASLLHSYGTDHHALDIEEVIDANTPFLGPSDGTRLAATISNGLLRQTSNYGSMVTEEEILTFVQNRRASIISADPSKKNLLLGDGDILSVHENGLLEEPETDLKTEITLLGKYSIPLIITFVLQYSLTIASVFSVGRLGSSELAAVSLSSMTANISGYAIIQGVSTCLDTLCAQAYGRNDFRMVGVHFLRCTILLFMLYVPIAIIWIGLAKHILLAMVPDPELCDLAARYLRMLAFGLPGYILFENGKHYLQAQGVFHASTYVLAICAPMNGFLNYLLVWDPRFGLGFIGAPFAVVITNWTMAALLYLYIWRIRGYECWCGFTKDCFSNWGRMINLATPGVLMVEAEWLAFEIVTLSASRFGTAALATQSVVSTICILLYQMPFAISIAASTRIAWFIGAASKKAATVASNASMITAVALGCCNATLLLIFRTKVVRLFTSDPEVIEMAHDILIMGAMYQINDCLACVTGGVLRGQGRQKIGGYLNLFSYYCVALPVAFLCGFGFHMELFGLWIGMVVALFFVSILQTYFVIYSDWDKVIAESIEEAIMENGNAIDSLSLVPSVSTASSFHF